MRLDRRLEEQQRPLVGRTAGGGQTAAASHDGSPAKTPVTLVNKGAGVLPNDQGQVWREYDIRPYTSRVTNTERPEQAIVDWISAGDRDRGLVLRAAGDSERQQEHAASLPYARKCSVWCWISWTALSAAKPKPKRSAPAGERSAVPTGGRRPCRCCSRSTSRRRASRPGSISKENAAILLAQLRQRTDFREQNSPSVPIHNGQSHTVTRTTPRTFVRSVRMRPDVWPGHELVSGQMQEGFSLQISPLMSLDGNTIDAVIKCEVDQIEKLVSVNVDIPSVAGGAQRVPDPGSAGHQLAAARTFPLAGQSGPDAGLRRRRRRPTQERMGPLGLPLPPLPFTSGGRADALVLVESNGKASQTLLEAKQDFRRPPRPRARRAERRLRILHVGCG